MERHGGIFNAYYEVKEGNMTRLLLYNSSYINFWKRQNGRDGKKKKSVIVSGCGEGKEMNRQITEDF